ncbi:unnamed protein product [Sphagnum jensenii]|uniref:Uncharacterized protein n=1 Tax=Sphagnum jensenii TaxID=128206 RepID=A0ABP0VHV6_9BRYO
MKMVSDNTTTAWNTVLSRAQDMTAVIEISARSNMKQVMEQEVALKGRIIELIASSLRPFIAEHGARTLRPVLDVIAAPISAAFAQSVQYFYSTLTNRFNAGELNTPPKRSLSIRAIAKRAESYWCSDSLLYFPAQTISKIYSHNPQVEEHFPEGSYSLSDLKHFCINQVRDLAFRALFVFIKSTETVTTGKIEKTVANLTRYYLEDAKRMIRKTLKTIMVNMMSTYIVQLWTPCAQVAQPVQHTIDVIPTAGLSQLFHVNCLMHDVIQDVVDRSINAAVDGYKVQCDEFVDRAQADMLLPITTEDDGDKMNDLEI